MPKRKLKFGVIGAGGIAYRRTMPAMLKAKNCRIAAVMDPVGAERIAAELKIPAAYASEADLLADRNVEAVYIASPVACHAQQIALAAEAGKHILCEKPLTAGLASTHAAVETCRAHNVYLQEGFMMKFHGAHQAIKAMIAEGRLGKIVSMRAQLSCWYPTIPGAWRQDPYTGGGGALIDMATHLYDLLIYFAGPVRHVVALTGNLVHDYRSEDASTTLLQFRSGAHATVDCFYCIPDEASRTRLEIYGTRGAILTEGTIGQGSDGRMEGLVDLNEAGYDAAQAKDVVWSFQTMRFKKINPYAAECEYFADCVLAGRAPEINNGQNAIDIADLVERAYRSTLAW